MNEQPNADINFLYLAETNELFGLIHVRPVSFWTRLTLCLKYLFSHKAVELNFKLSNELIDKMKKAAELVN